MVDKSSTSIRERLQSYVNSNRMPNIGRPPPKEMVSIMLPFSLRLQILCSVYANVITDTMAFIK